MTYWPEILGILMLFTPLAVMLVFMAKDFGLKPVLKTAAATLVVALYIGITYQCLVPGSTLNRAAHAISMMSTCVEVQAENAPPGVTLWMCGREPI